MFGLLAAANAGDLTPGYVSYAPTIQKTIQYAEPLKTIQYSAPIAKTIYQPSPVYAKTIAYTPSHHGTVSHHGKTIATPHSYVNKYDTRYVHEDPQHYYPSTIVKTPYTPYTPYVPAVTKVVSPTITKVVSPVVPYEHGYEHGHHYGHHDHYAPLVKTAAVSYSPAVAVSHASFTSAHGAQYAW